MTLNLSKDIPLDLSKAAPKVTKFYVGAGWDMAEGGPDIDVDLSVLLLRGGKGAAADLAYFNKKQIAGGAVQLGDDNRTGEGDGDDEYAVIDLSKMPDDVDGVVVLLNIYQGAQKNQRFGQIVNCHVRLLEGSDENGNPVANYKLNPGEAAPNATAIAYVRFNRVGDHWDFVGLGDPLAGEDGGDLGKVVACFG